MEQQLIYGISDKPKFGKMIVFAFQQIIAIMAATLLVPMIVSQTGLIVDPSAALFGAGVGTFVYLMFTKMKSPVFLGSSFTFIGALSTAALQGYGYFGLIIGVCFAGLVYVVIAILIKFIGSKWINKLLPPVVIAPIITLIGLSLSGTATGWMATNGGLADNYSLITILCGLVTFFAIVITSTKGSKEMKLIPFIIGIGAGYVFAILISVIGMVAKIPALVVVDFTPFAQAFGTFSIESIFRIPNFTIVRAFQTAGEYAPIDATMLGNLALLFVPIAVVELAQHISDHKILSNVVGSDLLESPGLARTLLGDGVGSMAGSLFAGCANTTYGESIGCVAITKNAATVTILTSAFGCMLLSLFTPFVVIINTIPKAVMGGACIALYGFIAVSGLQLLSKVNLSDSRNLYVVASILVIGIGGLTLDFGVNPLTGKPLLSIASLATALIVGILVNTVVRTGKSGKADKKQDGISDYVGVSKEVFEEKKTLNKE